MIPAAVLCTVFLALSGLHVYWACGGRRGWPSAIPLENGEPMFQPGPAATFGVAAALFAAALVAVWRGVFSDVGHGWIPGAGVWILAAVFGLRAVGDFRYIGLFKRVRGTDFARNDTRIYSPLCLVIAGLSVWLGLG